MDLHDFRREYLLRGLSQEELHQDPIAQFEQWFNELLKMDVFDPTSMVLATADQQQQPSQRIVLLKELDQRGFTFFTNKDSDKAKAMLANPKVSLHFPWNFIERQVKIEGFAELLTEEENLAYFSSRPRESQLAAWASPQSRPVSSREELMSSFAAKQEEYPEEIPLPPFWGGYRIVPQLIEFWQGGEHRLHDRFIYQRQPDNTWVIQRLAP